jgi:hypothetical protein
VLLPELIEIISLTHAEGALSFAPKLQPLQYLARSFVVEQQRITCASRITRIELPRNA